MKTPPANHFLTAQEVADLFRIAIKTVYQWSYQGKLRKVKIGRQVRFPKDQALLLIESDGNL